MVKYISTRGGCAPVEFDAAVLEGFAPDGGLFVPEEIPKIPAGRLAQLKGLPYPAVAREILSLFIDGTAIPPDHLKQIIDQSFSSFEHPDLMPLIKLDRDRPVYVMELFRGPTLSFKDIAMGFLVNAMDYFLQKRGQHRSIILATTGDTGPAAAWAAAGKQTIDCWPLYPAGMISEEQERQMTTLPAENIHPICVRNCRDGGDDLDAVVARLFAAPGLSGELGLSSVNSINWCRVMVQSVHYIYGYLSVCDRVGEPVEFCVPSGAFGNLFAGFLAREMGVPLRFICANNRNRTLDRTFGTGWFRKEDLIPTLSSAIDIVIPYNFWRFVYFSCGRDPEKIKQWMRDFEHTGAVRLDDRTITAVRNGFRSVSISDETTVSTIVRVWKAHQYLLDPHSAVAVAAVRELGPAADGKIKTVCLATAHPAKFPQVIRQALAPETHMPDQGIHPSIEREKTRPARSKTCDIRELESFLTKDIRNMIRRYQ